MTEIVTDSIDELVAPGVRFGTIYADPPWRYGNTASRGAAQNHYPTMSVDEICALPVSQIVADAAHLHLWTTNAFIFDAFRVVTAWGFEYRDTMVWVKPQMGMGNYWRVSAEFLVLGVRGDAPFTGDPSPSWIKHDRLKHSEKPDVFRRLVETVSPGPRLEMFARIRIPGWSAWGNEVITSLFSGDGEGDRP